MIWSFLTVLFAGWIYVDAAYRGPTWQHYLFKPLTLILLLAWAWQAPIESLSHYLILGGLVSVLIGGSLSLLGVKWRVWMMGALFLCTLLYSLALLPQLKLNDNWIIPAVLLLIGMGVLAWIWSSLAEMRWPILVLLLMNLTLCWLASLNGFNQSTDSGFSQMLGADLILFSYLIWLLSQFRRHFTADCAIYEGLFMLGHFMIARSLWLA